MEAPKGGKCMTQQDKKCTQSIKIQSSIDIQTKVQQCIYEAVNDLLCRLSGMFNPNELAYYSLQGKNELQIRDKIAWNLQCIMDKKYGESKYIVRREWSPKGRRGREKVDLAVLQVDSNNTNTCTILSLFEFKAHSFLNHECWPRAEFLKDINKMYDIVGSISNGYNIDMYFVFLHSSQNQNQKNGGFLEAVAYPQILNGKGTMIYKENSLQKIAADWQDFYDEDKISEALKGCKEKYEPLNGITVKYKDKPKIPEPMYQSVGTSFGYEWYIAPMIWGPYRIWSTNPIFNSCSQVIKR